jgi:hypothetical protein
MIAEAAEPACCYIAAAVLGKPQTLDSPVSSQSLIGKSELLATITLHFHPHQLYSRYA